MILDPVFKSSRRQNAEEYHHHPHRCENLVTSQYGGSLLPRNDAADRPGRCHFQSLWKLKSQMYLLGYQTDFIKEKLITLERSKSGLRTFITITRRTRQWHKQLHYEWHGTLYNNKSWDFSGTEWKSSVDEHVMCVWRLSNWWSVWMGFQI
jgi:hypothetical protein